MLGWFTGDLSLPFVTPGYSPMEQASSGGLQPFFDVQTLFKTFTQSSASSFKAHLV